MLHKIKTLLLTLLLVALTTLAYSIYTNDWDLKDLSSDLVIYLTIAVMYVKIQINAEGIKNLIPKRRSTTK